MSFIRKNSEERTGFQDGAPFDTQYSPKSDFVMVYRLDETTVERIKGYRDKGYAVHLMVGISWGRYADYLEGKYDGREHTDEGQADRFGNTIMHDKNTPYMVPTVEFADYLTQKLKAAVDAGVEAIHVEEPEFWDRAGYSQAFRREYLLYYRKAWQPAYESVDSSYKTAKLKAYLYARTIDRVSSAVKEYALKRWNRVIRFYVPTHSLLNYTQWKIVSPEGKLADIPGVDGCIAQVWTGTSREKNWLNGVIKERTFETAYLEYGVMQELVKGTGRKMWFLHDPIEDNPIFDWTDYRMNYLKTVTASLLHPKVNSYEICPWPNRVFLGKYPKDSPEAESIPCEYATVLNNTFQTLGDMELSDSSSGVRVGILMSDSQLYQRSYPDSLIDGEIKEEIGTVLTADASTYEKYKRELFDKNVTHGSVFGEFVCSNAFPQFFSLAMPLLKYGLPVRPVLLDNARRYNGYLDDYDVLIMSYEFMKPDYPDVNNVIANWVKKGGLLCYIGDGSDPYHKLDSWWSGSYPTPARHLFESMNIEPADDKEVFSVGRGKAAVWKTVPAFFSYSKANADSYRSFIHNLITENGFEWEYSNVISLKRGKYLIAAVLDESINDEMYEINGLYADMFAPDFAIVEHKKLAPDENALLCDLSFFKGSNEPQIIGTSVSISELTEKNDEITLTFDGMEGIQAYIRLYVPCRVSCNQTDISCAYDERSASVLLGFKDKHRITLKKEKS